MGKSGGRKKKGGSNQVVADNSAPSANGGVDVDSSIFLKRALELKEEGNKRFQNKDYAGALEQYENALRLTPKNHLERAVFHSNRAACLMQMKPIDYETVIAECTMALQVQPQYVRALLRRARSFEAIGKYEMAMQDVQGLLATDPNHRDALEIAQRLRTALGPRQEAQQDLQSRPSPAALGASAVRGAPIAGLGPCLPARPASKKAANSAGGLVAPANSKPEKSQPTSITENGPETKSQMPKVALKPSNASARPMNTRKENHNELSSHSSVIHGQHLDFAIRWRPLKLVYDHDIRLAQMPVNCNFRTLRDVVSKRFPSSKSVLIKYKDSDGDLVTITSTDELRLAESGADSHLIKEPDADKSDSVGTLRLHIVEVSPEQEPPLPEEEEVKPVESEGIKGDETGSHTSQSESVPEAPETEADKMGKEAPKEKPAATEDAECKEVEMDDWLFEFAQLFRSHVGIDPDAHIDLHELGMELCSEALEETVTSEEAQDLFDKAASKFQEVAALAFFNWGNIHMCAARKRIPLDESGEKEKVAEQLQVAYDWVKEKYSLARKKYEEALLIKPDFYEGLLALGQQQFEMAKLNWSFALAKKMDLSAWDSSETLQLFDSAEEKMKGATEMWEKLEEQRANELKDPSASKKEELMRRRKKQGGATEGETSAVGGHGEISAEEAAEQAAVMRSQIHLFWGNMLFERSQVECKLGMGGWKENLDTAVERFKLAGASEADISLVLKNHCSNGDAKEGDEKKIQNPQQPNKTDETDKTRGKKVELCGLIQYVNLFGIAIGYTIAASVSMMAIKRSNCYHYSHGKDPCHMSSNGFMIAFGVAEIILSQIPDFDQVWWLSIVAAIMSFTYSTVGLGLGIGKVAENKSFKGNMMGISVGTVTQAGTVTETQKIWRSLQALGAMAFAYSFSIILIEIQDTLKSPPAEYKTMRKATLFSVTVTSVFYLLCGCMGYAAFGDNAPGNLLTGFGFYNPYWLLDIANFAIVVHLIGAYQVFCQPLFAFVEKWSAQKWGEGNFVTEEYEIPIPLYGVYKLNLFRLVWRTIFVLLTTLIAMLMPFFNDVVGILGAFGFWPLTVYFPIDMYISHKKIQRWSSQWLGLQLLSVTCLFISIAAAVGSIAGVVLDLKSYKPFKTSY